MEMNSTFARWKKNCRKKSVCKTPTELGVLLISIFAVVFRRLLQQVNRLRIVQVDLGLQHDVKTHAKNNGLK